MTEMWLPIPGFDGYEVSDAGRVRSVPRTTVSSRGVVKRYRGVVLRPAVRRSGHLHVLMRRGGRSETRVVHRLVMLAFVGPCPEGMEVCHENGIPSDNRLENLRYGTPSSNMFDAVRHGTHSNAARTRCPRKHLLVAPNLRASVARAGGRGCLSCQRAVGFITSCKRSGRPVPDLQELSDKYYEKLSIEPL